MNCSLACLGLKKRRYHIPVPGIFAVAAVFLYSFCGVLWGADPTQQLNLPDASGPRFQLSEYETWPANHGDARVCLWHDDKLGALTLTIDDNWEPDHPFWLSMQKKYGTILTWFIIIDKVNAWALWSMLANKGHDVQSHTRSHMSSGTDQQFHDEYGGSQADINKMMPGHKCRTLAYPSGAGSEPIARQYFIAARGVYGVMNNANTVKYMQVNSGGYDETHRIDVLLDPNEKLYNASYYRGWLSVHYHGVGDQAATEAYLAYIKQKEDSLWVGRFTHVAQYGQERDTHKLTVTATAAAEIRFTLTDSMADSAFDFPLTVKVRVNNDWENATARQDTVDREVSLVTHNSTTYLLVQAVPDKGEVVVTKAAPAGVKDSRQGVRPVTGHQTVRYDLQGRRVERGREAQGVLFSFDRETDTVNKLMILN